MSDGLPVHLYLVSEKKSPDEVDIMLYLASGKLTAGEHDRGSHIIPIFEVLEVDDNHSLCVIVTPLMRVYDDPRFENMGEAVNFLGQVLEVVFFYPSELAGNLIFSLSRVWNSCTQTGSRIETLSSRTR